MTDSTSEYHDLVLRACAGDRGAFDALILESRAKLRAVIRRMVGHPDDTDDLMQETILRAWEAIAAYRGDASFTTWLCAIGVRQSIDHLRKVRRWRPEAQIVYSNACAGNETLQQEVIAVVSDPAFSYEVREHIAYCFTCVGRSLPPEQQAILVLREFLGLTNLEAARALGISEPVLRHQLSAARAEMQQRFEGLCSLVSKRGVCYQCKGLRDVTPAGQQGSAIPELTDFDDRLQIMRAANIDAGVSQVMHDLFWRRTAELEEAGAGSTTPESDCGKP